MPAGNALDLIIITDNQSGFREDAGISRGIISDRLRPARSPPEGEVEDDLRSRPITRRLREAVYLSHSVQTPTALIGILSATTCF